MLDASQPLLVDGVPVPRLLYGTAWKEERTGSLVADALVAGFRGIDTANQRKHYHEAGVGEGLREAALPRETLFLQTKFTFRRGQDHRLPYDSRAPVGTQVAQSCESSLEHLGVDMLDAYLLHGPSRADGLGSDDWAAWEAMEALQRRGVVRLLGVSNVSAAQLAELHASASVKPALVQSRTLVWPSADGATRAFCREHGLGYEGFSLLTAAPGLLAHPALLGAAARAGLTPAAAALRFWLEQGAIVLTGTTSPAHMRDDLAALSSPLRAEDAAALARLLRA